MYLLNGFRYILKKYNNWVIYDIYTQESKFDFYRYIATYIFFESSVLFYILGCLYKPINGVLSDLMIVPFLIPILYILSLRLFSKVAIILYPFCLIILFVDYFI